MAIDIDERQFDDSTTVLYKLRGVRACRPEAGALVMQPMDITQLVVHDRQAEEAERMRIRARACARMLETEKAAG